MIKDFFSNGRKEIIIQAEEWTDEDTEDLKTLLSFPRFDSLRKLLRARMMKRTGELVSGDETRDRIDEIADLLLELDSYANTEGR
jgi:hypothetical protein